MLPVGMLRLLEQKCCANRMGAQAVSTMDARRLSRGFMEVGAARRRATDMGWSRTYGRWSIALAVCGLLAGGCAQCQCRIPHIDPTGERILLRCHRHHLRLRRNIIPSRGSIPLRRISMSA